jgi:predicted acyltransferase (DUF342 family)
MLIDDLNALLPAPKDFHIIPYGTEVELAALVAEPDFDFAYQYDGTFGLYQKVDGAWTHTASDLSLTFFNKTTGMDPPIPYYGIEINGVMDLRWPPNLKDYKIYVVDRLPQMYTYPKVRKGEIVVTGDLSYILGMTPQNVRINWDRLLSINPHTGSWWGKSDPVIDTVGVQELGKTLDFHCLDLGPDDYTFRLTNISDGNMLGTGNLVLKKYISQATSTAGGGKLILAHGDNTDIVADGANTWEVYSYNADLQVNFVDGTGTAINISTYTDVLSTFTVDMVLEQTLHTLGNVSFDSNLTVLGDVDNTGTLHNIGSVTLDSDLSVGGNVSLAGALDVGGDTSIGGNLHLIGSATFDSTLIVASNTDIGGNVDIAGTLHNVGDVSFDNNLHVLNNASISNNLYVINNSVLTGTLEVHDNVLFDSNLNVTGNTAITGTLSNTGNASFVSDVSVGGNTSMTGTLNVASASTINSTLSVTGAATFSNTVDISGNTTLSSNLTTYGATTLYSTLNTSYAVTFDRTLSVGGNTTLSSNLTTYGATSLYSTLYATHAVTFDRTLAVGGNTTLSGSASIGSSLTVGNATTLNSTLHTVGNVTLDNNLSVGGNTTLSGTQNVTGATTLNSTLHAVGATTLSGTLHTVGNTTLDNNLSVGGNTSISGTQNVTGAATLNSTLHAVGATTLDSTLYAAGKITGNNGLELTTGVFTGDGSGLTTLNGSNISSGTVPFARLPTGTTSTRVAVGNHTHDTRYAIETPWQYLTYANSGYQAANGDRLLVNTSSSYVNIMLPSSPSVGDTIVIVDAYGTFNSYYCYVNNGTIRTNQSTAYLTSVNSKTTFVYVDSYRGWVYF